MKVLLRKNVYKLGKIGDVVEVKNGYARNYLVPQGIAYQPTEANIRAVEAEKAKYLEVLAEQRKELQVRADSVNGKEVTIAARANVEGHLYGSVGPAQIAAALSEIGAIVNPDEVIMAQAIRQLDKYDVEIRFDEEVSATVSVWVVPTSDSLFEEIAEEASEPAAVEAAAAEAAAAKAAEDEFGGGVDALETE